MEPISSGLRAGFSRWGEAKARVFAVTSGKGGVGKTNICANLGIALSRFGRRVCILDADSGPANIHIVTGQHPLFNLDNLLSGEKSLDDILITGPGGVTILPQASGLTKLGRLSAQKTEALFRATEELERRFEYILIDTSSDISEVMITLILSAPETILVVTPEPTSLTDSYNLMKVLKERGYAGIVRVVTNLVESREDSLTIFNQFNKALSRYLGIKAELLGRVVLDRTLMTSVIEQNPVTLGKPQSRASLCFNALAENLESSAGGFAPGKFGDYWKHVAGLETKAPSEGAEPGIEPPAEENVKELGDAIVGRIRDGRLEEEAARRIIRNIEDAFLARYKKNAIDFKTVLHERISQENVPEADLLELSFVIDSVFEMRFRKPIRDVEDMFIKLLEEQDSSEARLERLFETLNNTCRTRYRRPVYDLLSILEAELKSPNFPETEFGETVQFIRNAYRTRFEKDLTEPLLFSVEEMIENIGRLKDQESAMDELMESVLRIKKERLKMERRLSTALHGRKVP